MQEWKPKENPKDVSPSSPFLPLQPVGHGPAPSALRPPEGHWIQPAWGPEHSHSAPCSRSGERSLVLGSKDISTSTWVLTIERLRSPNRCQRSERVFHPTCRMMKRPTNLTPRAPARLMPVRLSQNHQGAEKGLKTNKTQFSLVAGTKLNSKRSSGEGQRSPDSQMLPCGLSHEGSQPQGPHMVPRQTWSVKPETAGAPCGSTMWEHDSSGEEGHGSPGEVSKGCQVCKSLFFTGDQSSGRKRKIQRSPLDSGRPSPVKASNYWVLLCVRHCSEHFTCVCVCVCVCVVSRSVMSNSLQPQQAVAC